MSVMAGWCRSVVGEQVTVNMVDWRPECAMRANEEIWCSEGTQH